MRKKYSIQFVDNSGATQTLKVPPAFALEFGKIVALKYCGCVILGQHAVAAFRGYADALDVFWGQDGQLSPPETFYGPAMLAPAI